MDRRALVFLHIPKTAGTTLNRIIEWQYNPLLIFTMDPYRIRATAERLAALPGRANKWDYSIYYSSALAMRQGMNPYTTDLTPLAHSLGFELDKINHATDPPTFVMCFVPLTLLAPRLG